MKAVIAVCLSWLLTAHAMASNLTIAEQEKQYQDNLGWAQSAQQGITTKANGNLNIADYCDDAECVHQVNNPPQKGLNDSAIITKKPLSTFPTTLQEPYRITLMKAGQT
ncbi:hypothetical protein HJ161_23915 [Vibrio parahaemolyticus]|nr:hypothetical protein [Vibrio parahaemolyticus]